MIEPRVIVMGLDALNLEFVQHACGGDLLPHLRDALPSAAYGALESTTPPFSAPAWTTFATGKTPAHHGVLDFWRATYTPQRQLTPTSSRDVNGPTLWQIVSAAGKRADVVQVPMTYPPSPINGVMVSDMLMTPNEEVDFTYPQELKTELKSVFRDMQVKPYKSFTQDAESLAKIARWEARSGDVSRYLMEHYPADLFVSVTQATDVVQHFFRQYLYPANSQGVDPEKLRRFDGLLREAFAPIDGVVAHRLAQLDDNTIVFFVSDHGFGPATHELQVNRLLADIGLLHYVSDTKSTLRATVTKGLVRAVKTLDVFSLRRRLRKTVKRTLRRSLDEGLAQPRDWQNTRAFAGTASSEGIYVNLRGREPMGIVEPGAEYEAVRDQIIDGLLSLRNPESGEPIVATARRREEVYPDAPAHFPDVFVSFDRYPYLFRDSFAAKNWLQPLSKLGGYGRHNPQGFFAAIGRPIRAGATLTGARLVDVAPTILYAMGLPVPRAMDGRILTEAFTDEYVSEHAPAYTDDTFDGGDDHGVPAYTEEEEAQITSQLRDLGYV